MEVQRFQVVVIGSGSAGSTAARNLAEAGLRVAIVDEGAYGGTCANRGCDPKKVLRVGAELAHRAKALAEHGIVDPPPVDWSRLMRFKRTFTEPIPAAVESSLTKRGVVCFHGTASFVDDATLRVGDQGLSADRFIIATGARPRTLRFDGADMMATSEDVLEFDNLPEHAIFVGGGYVSFELASILAACGVACTIIHRDDSPLPALDPILVRGMMDAARERGVEIVLNADVVGIERVENGFHVHARSGDEHHTYETDVAIHGAGREANIGSLNLKAAGIEATGAGIQVDAYLRASERAYAIGDCTDRGPNLTPIAQLHARITAHNILGRSETFQEDIVPRVLFTLPEIAAVGLTEAEAREAGVDVEIVTRETSGWFSSRRIGQKHSGSRILIDRSTGLIVGAHLLGEGSEELIHLFALAMREGIRAQSLKALTYAFPTYSSDIPSML